MTDLKILPLALTMMAGPQIMAAIVFVTHERALRVSIAFVAGVASATVIGVVVTLGLAEAFDASASLGDDSDRGSLGTIVQLTLVGLLVLAAVKSYLGRETAEPPKWLGELLGMNARAAFRTGMLVIFLMPGDIVVMLTVGVNIVHSDGSLLDALPFIGLTAFVAAIPLLGYLVLHRQAVKATPKVREWMNANSWLVNILVYAVFAALILG